MKRFFLCALTLMLVISIFLGCKMQVNASSTDNKFLDMSAKSYIVMDDSGNILLKNNPNEKHEVASICKLMTTLITLEHIDSGALKLDDKVVASAYACDAEGSQAFLDAGSEYSLKDLLKSVIVASANDSAIVLAESIGGSERNFVEMMNARAKELGMNDTVYANSTGLPADNQYSTAYDTALLLNKVSEYDLYKQDCKIWMDKLVHPSGRETELVNTNRLIKYYPNCLTGKTGFTDEAGYCLSSTAKKDDMKLICVVLGCKKMSDRFSESIELYNYAFANFTNKKILSKDMEIDNNIKVLSGKQNNISISPSQDFSMSYEKNNKKEVEIKYNLPNEIKAPVSKGDIVGQAEIIVDGKLIKTVDLVANESIQKHSYGDAFLKVLNNFGIFN